MKLRINGLQDLEQKGELNDLEQKSRWYSTLILIEIIIVYQIYYGKHHLQHFIHDKRHIDNDLLVYLKNKHRKYYDRLLSLKLIGR